MQQNETHNGVGGGSVKSERKKERGKLEGERGGMSVVGWLVIDAGDKEAVARVKFRAGSGPVSSSASSIAIASACHRCSRSECNKMLPIVFRRSVVFYCLCCCLCFFFCCCSLFSLLFRLFCFFFFCSAYCQLCCESEPAEPTADRGAASVKSSARKLHIWLGQSIQGERKGAGAGQRTVMRAWGRLGCRVRWLLRDT